MQLFYFIRSFSLHFIYFSFLFFHIKLLIVFLLLQFSPMRISRSTLQESSIFKLIKKLNTKRRRAPFFKSKNKQHEEDNKSNYLCIKRLDKPYKLFLKQTYEHLLALQQFNQKTAPAPAPAAHPTSNIRVLNENSSPSTSSSSTKSDSFGENFDGLDFAPKLQIDSLKSFKEIDRFSSVLTNNNHSSETSFNFLHNIDLSPQRRQSVDVLLDMSRRKLREEAKSKQSEDYKKFIEPIQSEMLPSWSSIDANEKLGILDLFAKWHVAVTKIYQLLPHGKQKLMLSVALNEAKMLKKGAFRFDLNRAYLEKSQVELLNLSRLSSSSSPLSSVEPSKYRPNTRLVLKCFKKFIDAFECLSLAREAKHARDMRLYWPELNKFMTHMAKAILRCCFYVHENADLRRALIGLPPIYVLESDDCEATSDPEGSPSVKLEQLYEYVYVCRSYLKQKLTDRIDDVGSTGGQDKKALKHYMLTLNCLIRLIQMTTLIRENIIMKRLVYEELGGCDVDVYAHYLGNECRLIREYLKTILEIC